MLPNFQIAPTNRIAGYQIVTVEGQVCPNSNNDATDLSWNYTLALKRLNPFQAQSPASMAGSSLDDNIQVNESYWGQTVLCFNTEHWGAPRGFYPAPPPKLHYSTSWRSVTKRFYNKRLEEAKQMARVSCLCHRQMGCKMYCMQFSIKTSKVTIELT